MDIEEVHAEGRSTAIGHWRGEGVERYPTVQAIIKPDKQCYYNSK
jgi:hypothetical protein